eukprot:TRINITY_DN721_c0_g1_i1.p1 TRINITY_DN721_c0_g1~~TRINITY_DN721_c0_g1_i1.p1  ORF type:complete len:424 (+),score=112.26 TRINITY_DN721_c0_g1_i1:179-1450(+)
MSTVWVLGSGECDQLGSCLVSVGLGSDVFTAERPAKLAIQTAPETPPVKFVKVVCGGLHTLALTNEGKVYSWGCNDDGALGRSGSESEPQLVEGLEVSVAEIAAGDSHSIAYNKELGVVYMWGRYRNVRHGNFMDIVKTPTKMGEFEFKRKKIQKVVCGAHHTLFLVDGKVSAVGEPENENLGRLVLDRHKKEKSLGFRIERVHQDKGKYTDIFAGNYHSFAIKDGKLFAWGLNNYGQLGTGDYKSTRVMKEVRAIDGAQVANIVGGENHTVALMKNGDVYSWGKNDESQLGYKLEEERKMEDIKENGNKEELKSTEQQAEISKAEEMKGAKADNTKAESMKAEDAKAEGTKAGDAKSEGMKVDNSEVARNPEELAAQLGDQGDPTNCSPVPRKIEALANITQISAGTHYTYAIAQDATVYSW